MIISKSEIEKIADLSKLSYSDDEIELLIPELDKIICFASEINNSVSESNVNDDIERKCWNELREDVARESFINEKIFQKNCGENGYFVVHKVV